MKPWGEVASSADYIAMPRAEREAARQQYFEQVVAPHVPEADRDFALQQFTSSTAASLDARAKRLPGQNFDEHYNTVLTDDEEKSFSDWKAQHAPSDSGIDYDLRGAFKAGLKPAGAEAGKDAGHWPDTYKKPNHPTFSDQSQYKDYGSPGRWDGDKFVPPDGVAALNEQRAAENAARMTLNRKGGGAKLEADDLSLKEPPERTASWKEVAENAPAQLALGVNEFTENFRKWNAETSIERGLEAQRRLMTEKIEPPKGSLESALGKNIRKQELEQRVVKMKDAILARARAEKGIAQNAIDSGLVTPQDLSTAQEAFVSLVKSSPPMALGTATFLVTRNPVATYMIMGGGGALMQGASTYQEARAKGIEPSDANKNALIDAGLELFGEALPVAAAFKKGVPGLNKLVTVIAAEAGEEVATQFMQDVHKWATYDPSITWPEMVKNMQVAGLAGAGGGAIFGTGAAISDRLNRAQAGKAATPQTEKSLLEGKVYEQPPQAAPGAPAVSPDTAPLDAATVLGTPEAEPETIQAFSRRAGEEIGGVSHLQGLVESLQRVYIEQGPEAGRARLEDLAQNAPESSGFSKEVATPGFVNELDAELTRRAEKYKAAQDAPQAAQEQADTEPLPSTVPTIPAAPGPGARPQEVVAAGHALDHAQSEQERDRAIEKLMSDARAARMGKAYDEEVAKAEQAANDPAAAAAAPQQALASPAIERLAKDRPDVEFQHVPFEQAPARAQRAAKLIASAFGKDVVFVKADPTKYNGSMFTDDPSKVYVNVNADNSLRAITGHEILHTLKRTNQRVYANMMRSMRDALDLGKAAGYERYYAPQADPTSGYAEPPAKGDTRHVEEMAADIFGDLMNDPKFWLNVFQKSEKPFVKKLWDAIRMMLDVLRMKLRIGERRTGYDTREMIRDIEGVRRAVAQAYADWQSGKKAEPTTSAPRLAQALASKPKAEEAKTKPAEQKKDTGTKALFSIPFKRRFETAVAAYERADAAGKRKAAAETIGVVEALPKEIAYLKRPDGRRVFADGPVIGTVATIYEKGSGIHRSAEESREAVPRETLANLDDKIKDPLAVILPPKDHPRPEMVWMLLDRLGKGYASVVIDPTAKYGGDPVNMILTTTPRSATAVQIAKQQGRVIYEKAGFESATVRGGEPVKPAEAGSAREGVKSGTAEQKSVGETLTEVNAEIRKETGARVVLEDTGKQLRLSAISVPALDRGKGSGSKALTKVKEYAARVGKKVVLTASPSSADQAERLNRFYEKNGFVRFGKDPLSGYPYYGYSPKSVVDEQAHAAAPSPNNKLPEPSVAQKKAGNYPKGHVRVAGLDVSIENPEGSVRTFIKPNGHIGARKMTAHYGYIRGTEGADGDQLDIFIKPGTPHDYEGPVFVADQTKGDTRRFDEHKVLLGWDTVEEAKNAYQSNYQANWKGLESVVKFDSVESFKRWMEQGNLNRRAAGGPAALYSKPQLAKYEGGINKADLEKFFDNETNLGVYFDERQETSHYPDGDSAVNCTSGACQVLKILGRGEIWGYSGEDNPNAKLGMHDVGEGGHDFAIIDGRYLVDVWLKHVDATVDRSVFDLEDPKDAKMVEDLYGPRKNWSRLPEAEKLARAGKSLNDRLESRPQFSRRHELSPEEKQDLDFLKNQTGITDEQKQEMQDIVAESHARAMGDYEEDLAERAIRRDALRMAEEAGGELLGTERPGDKFFPDLLFGEDKKSGNLVSPDGRFEIEPTPDGYIINMDGEEIGWARDKHMAVREAKAYFHESLMSGKIKSANDALSVARQYPVAIQQRVAQAWQKLAEHKAIFRFADSDKKSLDGILSDMGQAPVIASIHDNSKQTTNPHFRIEFFDGNHADLVFRGKNQMYLNAASLRQGSQMGPVLYQAALVYARNNGKVLVPDPGGLTHVNSYRRTEQMISAALRQGTTKHMKPHPDQGLYGWKTDPQSKEDNLSNVALMAITSMRSVLENVPGVKDIRYNFELRQFEKNGKPIPKENLEKIAKDIDARAIGAGRSTIARAIFTNSLISDPEGADALIAGDVSPSMLLEGGDTKQSLALYSQPGMAKRAALGTAKAATVLARPVAAALDLTNTLSDMAAKIAGKPLSHATSRIYDRLVSAGSSLLKKSEIGQAIAHGVVSDYGLPEPYIYRRDDRDIDIQRHLRRSKQLIDKIGALNDAESMVAYQWMQEKPNSTEEARLVNLLPEESRTALAEMKDLVDQFGREAVELGLLSQETYDRNKMAYLHRSYKKYEVENPQAVASSQRAKTIRAEQFRGRGLRDDVAASRVPGAKRGDFYVRLEKRDPNPAGGLGRLKRVVYLPAGQPISAGYNGWRNDGVWEVRFTDRPGHIGMWRDFTREERERMGEIREVRYAFARTMIGSVHDIETAKFLKWVMETYSVADEDAVNERGGKVADAVDKMTTVKTYADNEWVEVPGTMAQGTRLYKYGLLQSRYIPGHIWNDIRATINMRSTSAFGKVYDNLLRAWKISKTALSPVVHTNNVMSNFIFLDMAEVKHKHLVRSLQTLLDAERGDETAKALLERYLDSGAELGTPALHELRREIIEPLLSELQGEENEIVGTLGLIQAVQLAARGNFRQAWAAAAASKSARLAAKPFHTLIAAYGLEDSVFRLATWIKETEEGKSDRQAGTDARAAFLDYRINAPWIAALRRGPFPFFAFTYRAVPLLAEGFANKPWKLMKYFAAGYAMNALSYAMLGLGKDDEKKERAMLPDEKSGYTILGVPRLLRMPWNDKHGSPVFLDIRRWIPGGDIFDVSGSHGAIPLPTWLSFGGPWALAIELASNKSQFTGQPVWKESDTLNERVAKTIDHIFKFAAPNLPIPNPVGYAADAHAVEKGLMQTYSWKAIMNAGGGATDDFGREKSLPEALASAVGVKVAAYPEDQLKRNILSKKAHEIRDLDETTARYRRELRRGGITQAEFEERMKKQAAKRLEINKKYAEKLGLEAVKK